MDGERSWVVEAETGLYQIPEVTLEGVQVLLQIHIEEGQSSSVVVQCHSDSDRMHRDPQIWTPAVVQKLIFVPGIKRGSVYSFVLSSASQMLKMLKYGAMCDIFKTR